MSSSSSSSSSAGSAPPTPPKPQSTAAQDASLKAILKKNIRGNTRKKYSGHQKVIWKWLLTQPGMAPYRNQDGSLTKRGCEIWASDPAWFHSFVSSLTLEIPEDEEVGEEVGEEGQDGDIIRRKFVGQTGVSIDSPKILFCHEQSLNQRLKCGGLAQLLQTLGSQLCALLSVLISRI